MDLSPSVDLHKDGIVQLLMYSMMLILYDMSVLYSYIVPERKLACMSVVIFGDLSIVDII